MPAAQVFQLAKSFEDSNAYILARVRGTSGDLISQASISEIVLRVYDKENPPETAAIDDPAVIQSRTLVKGDVVFDTLQTDSGWDTDADPLGFNVKIEIIPADIPRGSKVYRFEAKFTNATSKRWHAVFEVPSEGLYSS